LFSKAFEKPEDALKAMFDMQLALQRDVARRKPDTALDYDMAGFKQRVDQISKEWRNMNLEMAELLERLPFKEWKTYSPEALAGFTSDEQKLETWYEYIDVFHFFMNVGLLLGITPEIFVQLYMTKNAENFDRQKRGY
jgi:hypothetical protein